MKKIRLSYYAIPVMLAIAFLSGCKKDDDNDPAPPAQRILGVWNIVKETELLYDQNTNSFGNATPITITPGLFTADFRTDGKMYLTDNRPPIDRDTFTYQLYSDTLLLLDGDRFLIDTLATVELVTTDYYHDGTDSVKHVLEFKK